MGELYIKGPVSRVGAGHCGQRYKNLQFTDKVETDESLFGRPVKFHRGSPNVGVKVWVVGLIEWKSNHLLLFPDDHWDEGTSTSIIQTHVAPVTTIYTRGWRGYRNLNNLSFRHFTVMHKETFLQKYQDLETKAAIPVHSNQIEGAWKHAC